MRFPSIDALAARARVVMFRFPWVLAAAAIAATAGLIAVDSPDEDFWVRLSIVAAMGLPLMFALTLLAERRQWPGWKRTGALALAALALGWFLHVWPGPEQKHEAIRYFQLSAGLHLLAAFLPYLSFPERQGFWQYNRGLFEGFLRAALFTAVLFLGLAIALGAIDKLLGIDVPSETYLRLWLLLAFIANTWIFLGAVPEELESLESAIQYPRGLKVFTQYILLPLVAVYLVILSAYLVKILVSGEWPSGWIGYLVSSVATTGILGFLLVHPLRKNPGEGWIKTYSQWLFIGLIPAATMFLLALWKRVEPYGLTELRFLGLILGAWLLGIAILYTIRRDAGIRMIPVSLAALLLLTAYGPVSSSSRSVRSQAARLERLLEQNQLAGPGSDGAGKVTVDDRREISAALRFLLERDATDELKEVLDARVAGTEAILAATLSQRDSIASSLMSGLGLKYVPEHSWEASDYFSFEARGDSVAVPIEGYDYLVRLTGADSARIVLGADTLQAIFDSASASLRLRRRGEIVISFPFSSLIDSLLELSGDSRQQLSGVQMSVKGEAGPYRGMLALEWLNGDRQDGKLRTLSWRGLLFLGGIRESE